MHPRRCDVERGVDARLHLFAVASMLMRDRPACKWRYAQRAAEAQCIRMSAVDSLGMVQHGREPGLLGVPARLLPWSVLCARAEVAGLVRCRCKAEVGACT